MQPALYRVYQFFAAVKAGLPAWAGGIADHLTADDEALVVSILPTPAQQHLFARMPPNDKRHALAVARTLQGAGHQDRALLQAALLHDVAKSMGQPIIHRVMIVLLEAFWPAALRRLSAPGEAGWWRRPFVIHAHHPQLGADLATEVACDPLAISLIARHQEVLVGVDREEERLLAALQWADGMN